MQERLELCELPNVILDGLRLHVRPEDGETETVRLTVPPKPLIGETVIVEAKAVPASVFTPVGLAVRL